MHFETPHYAMRATTCCGPNAGTAQERCTQDVDSELRGYALDDYVNSPQPNLPASKSPRNRHFFGRLMPVTGSLDHQIRVFGLF